MRFVLALLSILWPDTSPAVAPPTWNFAPQSNSFELVIPAEDRYIDAYEREGLVLNEAQRERARELARQHTAAAERGEYAFGRVPSLLMDEIGLTEDQQKTYRAKEQERADLYRPCLVSDDPVTGVAELNKLAASIGRQLGTCSPRTPEQMKSELDQLVKVMERDLDRPNMSKEDFGPEGTAFSGSYDWHSSVHAHWALLSIARIRGDRALANRILQRLKAGLPNDRTYLRQYPEFELPYGQSWLLLLLTEMQKHEGVDQAEIAALKQETFSRVMGALPELLPRSAKRLGQEQSTHNSWFFNTPLLQLTYPQGSPERAQVNELTQQLPAKLRTQIHGFKNQRNDFGFPPGLLAMIDRLDGRERTRYFPLHPPQGKMERTREFDESSSPERPRFFGTGKDSHRNGLLVSSLWPYAMDAHKDPLSCHYWQNKTQEFFANTEGWSESYEDSHWLPQMIWMGLWLEMGRP